MDYWKECIEEAFEDSGIVATESQIENVISAVKGAHENYGTATGEELISNPVELQADKDLRNLQREIDRREKWERDTQVCPVCMTTGSSLGSIICYKCSGKGRIIRS